MMIGEAIVVPLPVFFDCLSLFCRSILDVMSSTPLSPSHTTAEEEAAGRQSASAFATATQRDRREMQRVLRRRLRMEASVLEDDLGNTGGEEGFNRAIGVLRADGLSSQRERQLMDRFHRERGEERFRAHTLWGEIDRELDSGREPSPPGRTNTAMRRRLLFERTTRGELGRDGSLSGLLPEYHQRNERETPGMRAARLNAARARTMEPRASLLGEYGNSREGGFFSFLHRRPRVGDYMVRDAMVMLWLSKLRYRCDRTTLTLTSPMRAY
jgi:hypothetical protein